MRATINNYNSFIEKSLTDRFFKHKNITVLIEKLSHNFTTEIIGHSKNGKSINAVKWGKGKTKVMLWSQMHGDEATGTMAIFDLFNFLQQESEVTKLLHENCEILCIPMINPDGAEAFTRRNAQQIDINRDYLQQLTPEGILLKQTRDSFNPDFGFNLHDQSTLWSVEGSLKPATLSYLAPAYNNELSVNTVREKAMHVIADMFSQVTAFLPNHIGLFDDEHEPRAFGDNFQKAGTATILIEAGGYKADFEKQEIRKYYFASILSGLISIAKQFYKLQTQANYFAIPKNNKQIFHYLINNLIINNDKLSIGINYEETPYLDGNKTSKKYTIEDIGDLSLCNAYHIVDATGVKFTGEISYGKTANFELFKQDEIILAFKNGDLLQKH